MKTVIFPMAGVGERFGNQFKPFLNVGPNTFIHTAVASFMHVKSDISKFVFVFRKDHDELHHVSKRLDELFPSLSKEYVIIEGPTSGPAATVFAALSRGNIRGEVVICDCDHYLDVQPLWSVIEQNKPQCALSLYPVSNEPISKWSIARMNPDDGKIISVAEGVFPEGDQLPFGIIGCTYFSSATTLQSIIGHSRPTYMSGVVQEYINNHTDVLGAVINDAVFFGDPERLAHVEWAMKSKADTIFIDLDGVICEHQDQPAYRGPLKIMPQALERMQAWARDGKFIVITTARDPAEELVLRSALKTATVPFSRLIMGVSSGTRYIINDRKPRTPFTPSVCAIEVKRNNGVPALPDIKQHTITDVNHGNSGASIYLMRDETGHDYIRKIVPRGSSAETKLMQQMHHMELMASVITNVPNVLGEFRDNLYTGYDMEVIAGKPISKYAGQARINYAVDACNVMFRYVYEKTRLRTVPDNALSDYLHEKIRNRQNVLACNEILSKLFHSTEVSVNGVEMQGISSIYDLAHEYIFHPRAFALIHGDLTLENVLIENECPIFLDTDECKPWNAIELDLGKMYQSVCGCYEDWIDFPALLVECDDEGIIAPNVAMNEPIVTAVASEWASYLNYSVDEMHRVGCFYAATHFLRMIPFKLRIDVQQANFAAVQAIRMLHMARTGELI